MGRTKRGIRICLAVDSHGVPASVILTEGTTPYAALALAIIACCCRHTQESRQRPDIAIIENLAQPRKCERFLTLPGRQAASLLFFFPARSGALVLYQD